MPETDKPIDGSVVAFKVLLREISRLQDEIDQMHIQLDKMTVGSREDRAENEQLRAEIEEWRSCARYDPLMNGATFKGWDRSQMDRCRKRFIEGAHADLPQSA